MPEHLMPDHPLRHVLRQLTPACCPGRVNFHCHTLCSDGSLSPERLGEQAVALGLADREGYLEDAARRAAELAGLKAFRLVRYTRPKGLLEGLWGEEVPWAQGLLQARFRVEYRYLGGGLW